MSQEATLSTATAAEAGEVSIDGLRQALQGRIEALRDAGALPTLSHGDEAASVAQWSNWTNG